MFRPNILKPHLTVFLKFNHIDLRSEEEIGDWEMEKSLFTTMVVRGL